MSRVVDIRRIVAINTLVVGILVVSNFASLFPVPSVRIAGTIVVAGSAVLIGGLPEPRSMPGFAIVESNAAEPQRGVLGNGAPLTSLVVEDIAVVGCVVEAQGNALKFLGGSDSLVAFDFAQSESASLGVFEEVKRKFAGAVFVVDVDGPNCGGVSGRLPE